MTEHDVVLAVAAGEDGPTSTASLVALGTALLLSALLARAGRRVGLPTIPFFVGVGILLGDQTGGPVLLDDSVDLPVLATFGLVLLLFHVGVEFPLEQVMASGRRLLVVALTYIALNVTGGIALGAALGWGLEEALVIGGAVGISSSAVVTKLLVELRRLANAETPLVLGIIVVEDIFLAGYLALLSPLLGDADSPLGLVLDVLVSFGFLLALLALARWGGRAVGWLLDSRELELLTIAVLGTLLLVAGLAADLGVSDAIGALLLGIVVSRTVLQERVERVVLPLRDAFAAFFFISFGASIDVGALGGVVVPALAAVLLTVLLNLVAGVVAARLYGYNHRAAANAGLTLLARGEFSLVLATLAVAAGLDERIGPFVALYVLVLAVLSPVLASASGPIARRLPDRLVRGFTYVRGETFASECSHLGARLVEEPRTEPTACAECLEEGTTWVHLRLCLGCGTVACCDDSPRRHATAHFDAEGHPLIASLEPGESWRWCYVDRVLLDGRDGGGRDGRNGGDGGDGRNGGDGGRSGTTAAGAPA